MTTWIRWSVRGAVCGAVFGLLLALGLGAVRAQSVTEWQDAWLSRLNRERAGTGAAPLRLSPVLNQVAQQQAEEMAASRRLRSPATELVADRLRQVGYSAHDWRQDYAFDPPPQGAVVHVRRRENPHLDGRFRDLGIGAAPANGGTFYVLLFGWHRGDYFAGATARLTDRARTTAELLARVNEVRRRSGLRPLAPNPLLDRLSQKHAEDMLARSFFGHRTPEGLGPSDRARAGGYRSGVGENIVEQRFSAEEALEAWMGSLGHRKNILDPHSREMGLGLAVGAGYDAAPGGYRVIWVQSFGRGE